MSVRTDITHLWRYEWSRLDDEPYIVERQLKIVKRTEAGYWVERWDTAARYENGELVDLKRWCHFVLAGDGKRFAHEQKEWAMYSFILRKRRYIRRLETSLHYNRKVLALAEAGTIGTDHIDPTIKNGFFEFD